MTDNAHGSRFALGEDGAEVWLVDYTTYVSPIDPALMELKLEYLQIKQKHKQDVCGAFPNQGTKTFSTGLLRIATILAANGVRARYVHHEDLEHLMDSNARIHFPPTVAFSATCASVPMCEELRAAIKELSPATRVVIGGPHVNVARLLTKRRYPFFDDYISLFEFEAAAAIVRMPVPIKPVKYVDYGLLPLPLKNYSINVFTGTGCRFKCAYCQDRAMPRFESSITGQLEDMMGKLPRGSWVHFFDSNLGYHPKRAIRVCEALKKLDHGFRLSCDMRAEMISSYLVKRMEEAGFKEVRIGMEASDAEVLRLNRRGTDPAKVFEAVETVKRHSSMYVALYGAVGLPHSTEESLQATEELYGDLLSSATVDEIKTCVYVPYPRDEHPPSTNGVIVVDENWSHYDRQHFPVFRYRNLSSESIWRHYLGTIQTINGSWIKGLNLKRDELPHQPHFEYFLDQYTVEEEEDPHERL